MKNLINKILREELSSHDIEVMLNSIKPDCDCCKYFDMDSVDRFGGMEHPIYYMIEKGEIHKLDYISPKSYIHKIVYGFGVSYEDALNGVRQRLFRSMELRMRADVPLAFCMSGGIDSNSLISIAKRVFDYDVHGFTIQNVDPRYDERELVSAAVADLGIRHTPIPINT